MGRIILEADELTRHMKKKSAEIGEHRIGEYYTQNIIKKYSKSEQDAHLADVIKTILTVPGGYWQIVDNMNYMPEFEHHKFRHTLSYEKSNVPRTIAKRELTVKQYANIYK